jgi:hypothetical protein
LEVGTHQRANRGWIQERFAAHRGTTRLDEITVGDRLEHVSGRARPERLEAVLLEVVHGENEDAHGGALPCQLARRL